MRAIVRSAAWTLMVLAAGGLVLDVAAQQQRARPRIPVRMVKASTSPIPIVIVGAPRGVAEPTSVQPLTPAPGQLGSSSRGAPGSMRIVMGTPTTATTGAASAQRQEAYGTPSTTRTVDLYRGGQHPIPDAEPAARAPSHVPAGQSAARPAAASPSLRLTSSTEAEPDAQLAGVREYLMQRDGAGLSEAPGTSTAQRLPQPRASAAGRTVSPAANGPAVAQDGDYRLGPGDVVDVFVWRNADLSRTVPVRPDGYISLPLAGEIVAAGKSAAQLEAEITAALSEFVQVPTVTITVTQIRSLVIYVLGRVNAPGPQTLERNVDVVQAIAMAGGVTEFADKNGIHVIRTVRGRRVRIPFPYGDIVKGKQDGGQLVLQAGDVIYVP